MATTDQKRIKRDDLSDEQKDKILDLIFNDDDDSETMMQIQRFLWDPEGPKP